MYIPIVSVLKRRSQQQPAVAADRHSEKGSSALLVIVLVLGLAIVWYSVYGLSNWIYGNKTKRTERTREYFQKDKHGKLLPTPSFVPREAGSYQVECNGVLSKTCKEVLPGDDQEDVENDSAVAAK